MNETNTEPEQREQVRDPEEYINQRRLKTIFDTREEIRDIRTKIQIATHDREINKYEALCAYRSLASSYVMETEPLLLKQEDGKELLYSTNFGQLTIAPTTRESETATRGTQLEVHAPNEAASGEWASISEEPSPVTYDLTGLTCLFELPDPITETWELKRNSAWANDTFTKEVKVQIGTRKLDNMVRALNNYLSELGFEADLENNDTEWEV